MNRRSSLRMAIGAGLSALATPLWAQTSALAMRRVGVLAPSTYAKEEVTLKPFFDEMRRLGWVEGQTVSYVRAYANDRQDALTQQAAELAAGKPELIFAPPGSAAVAAKKSTDTIPIVFASGVDPVRAGLVASLARPGSNATGITSIAESLAPKRVQLMREVLPQVMRIGLLGTVTDPSDQATAAALASLVASLGLTLIRSNASTPAEFDAAVDSLMAQRAEVVFTESGLAFNLRERLIELTNRQRLPVIGHRAQMADAGALFAYGPSLDGQLRAPRRSSTRYCGAHVRRTFPSSNRTSSSSWSIRKRRARSVSCSRRRSCCEQIG